MRIAGLSKVYHYHLKKCGGTSIKWWLGQYAADTRGPDAQIERDYWSAITRDRPEGQGLEKYEPLVGRQIFAGSDTISSHTPLGKWAPAGTFRFSVLRDPVERLISQVSDWRRLAPYDLMTLSAEKATRILDSQRLPLADFLDRWGRHDLELDNYLTRALAAATLGVPALWSRDMETLSREAHANLAGEFDFIGLSEHLATSLNRLAGRLGIPPEEQPPHLNNSNSRRKLADERAAAEGILAELTAHDRPLYDAAVRRFEEAAAGPPFEHATFESRHAADVLARLEGENLGSDVVYSVRKPLIGSGYHGRDGAGTESCNVWTGPLPSSTLYIPVPEGVPVEIRLWVRGYVSDTQRRQLRISIDNTHVEHRFEQAAGYADAVVVNAKTARRFVVMTIDVGQTGTTGEPGTSGFDSRLRGLAFDRYGWRIVSG